VFPDRGITESQHEIRDENHTTVDIQSERGDERQHHQRPGAKPGAPHRQGSIRDRTVAFGGMTGIDVAVEKVVDQIRRARRRTHGHHHHQSSHRDRTLAESPRRPWGGDHEQILGPLPGPGRDDERPSRAHGAAPTAARGRAPTRTG
jgi:ribosome-associated translation inhibitor RaiA